MVENVLLKTENLRSGYGDKPVLQGINIAIHKGERIGIIGRNGVGKTTLVKSIMGQINVYDGSILYNDKNIVSLSTYQRAREGLGYVPQGREIFPRLSVLDNLRIGTFYNAASQAKDWKRIYDYFPILEERAKQLGGTLSGGQQQQLALARVLLSDPKIILLDEPSEGIQPNIVQDISRILVELNERDGLTTVLIEQNIDMIRACCQRCYVIDKGKVVDILDQEQIKDIEIVKKHLSVS